MSVTITRIKIAGANTGNVAEVDSNNNFQTVVSGASLTASGSASALNADAIASTDVSYYQGASVQITGTFVGTLTFQGSNDNSNFEPVLMAEVDANNEPPASTVTAPDLVYVPILFRYFRIRMTAYTSGTATVTIIYHAITRQDLSSRVGHLAGGTDNTVIGNVSDSLKVNITNASGNGVVTTTEGSTAAKNGNAYTVAIASQNVASSSETSMILVTNPNGSGKTLYFFAAFLAANPDTNNWAVYKIHYDATVTANGTSQTIRNRLPGSANTSVASAFSLPTTTSFGNLIDVNMSGNNSQQFGNILALMLDPYWIIPPNHNLLISASVKANNTDSSVVLNWFEA